MQIHVQQSPEEAKRVYCHTHTLGAKKNKDDGNLFYDATFCAAQQAGNPLCAHPHLYAMKNV